MHGFRTFFEDINQLPDALAFALGFFHRKMDPLVLLSYADFLYDKGQEEASELFRGVGERMRDVKLRTGVWRGNLVQRFYKVMGHTPFTYRDFSFNDSMRSSWFISYGPDAGASTMARHIVHPGLDSYRLSLTNGAWSVYRNETDDRVSVVSARHQATPNSERHYPAGRVSLRDYRPIPVEEVPANIILFAFYRIIERQVRGGH